MGELDVCRQVIILGLERKIARATSVGVVPNVVWLVSREYLSCLFFLDVGTAAAASAASWMYMYIRKYKMMRRENVDVRYNRVCCFLNFSLDFQHMSSALVK